MKIDLNVIGETEPPPIVTRYVGFKGLLYPAEGGRAPTDLLPHPPAIIPAYSDRAVPITEDIQWMSYDLQRHFCEQVTKERWREPLHHHAFAMTNKGNGYAYPGGIPLRDYINGRDLTAMDGLKPALPKYDKVRTYQGSFITGRQEGNLIYCTPGVDGIDANGFRYVPGTPEAALTLNKIIRNVWYSVSVATGDPPVHIRQQWGAGCVIVFPFIMDRVVNFEAKYFTPWDDVYLPNPTEVYTPI